MSTTRQAAPEQRKNPKPRSRTTSTAERAAGPPAGPADAPPPLVLLPLPVVGAPRRRAGRVGCPRRPDPKTTTATAATTPTAAMTAPPVASTNTTPRTLSQLAPRLATWYVELVRSRTLALLGSLCSIQLLDLMCVGHAKAGALCSVTRLFVGMVAETVWHKVGCQLVNRILCFGLTDGASPSPSVVSKQQWLDLQARFGVLVSHQAQTRDPAKIMAVLAMLKLLVVFGQQQVRISVTADNLGDFAVSPRGQARLDAIIAQIPKSRVQEFGKLIDIPRDNCHRAMQFLADHPTAKNDSNLQSFVVSSNVAWAMNHVDPQQDAWSWTAKVVAALLTREVHRTKWFLCPEPQRPFCGRVPCRGLYCCPLRQPESVGLTLYAPMSGLAFNCHDIHSICDEVYAGRGQTPAALIQFGWQKKYHGCLVRKEDLLLRILGMSWTQSPLFELRVVHNPSDPSDPSDPSVSLGSVMEEWLALDKASRKARTAPLPAREPTPRTPAPLPTAKEPTLQTSAPLPARKPGTPRNLKRHKRSRGIKRKRRPRVLKDSPELSELPSLEQVVYGRSPEHL